MASVRALLQAGGDLPSDCGRRDTEILLCHCLDKNRAWLFTWPEAEVAKPDEQQFRELLAARMRGTPIAHLTGLREFWSLQLEVSEHTLIPRIETETLVEWALELPLPDASVVLDLGTGSGAIALALAQERANWQLTAVDACEQALTVARRNGCRLGLSRVGFLRSDWFAALGGDKYSLLVSNPPYIEEDDRHLAMGDLPFEPRKALVAADRGLADLTRIIEAAPSHLLPAGWLLLEHGFEQGAAVRHTLCERGFEEVQTRTDLAGHERVTGGCWHAE
jgi:release factor glutamine methyltransferase